MVFGPSRNWDDAGRMSTTFVIGAELTGAGGALTIEGWQIEMAMRPAPAVANIIERSSPVLSFGDPLSADVATLGINPSRKEFYSTTGELLTGAKRRLATTESLGSIPGHSLTEDQARTVVAECNGYFARNSYGWFNPLEALLNTATGASYYDRSACHLDLVQWATEPVWGRLTDRAAAALLLEEGQTYLETLLARSNVHLVLLNGATVVNQLQHIGLARLREVKRVPKGNATCRLLVGEGAGINYVAWSTNLQTSFGVSSEFKQRLAGEVRQLVEALLPAMSTQVETFVPATPTQVEAPMNMSDVEIDDDGFLPRGVKVSGKREFADLLRRWHDQSRAKTIGDVGSYGGTACITVDLGGDDVVLNVDTKRGAVTTYLDHVRRLGPDLPWRVVANNRGTVNKVIFSDNPADAAGWYHYLRKALAQPGQL
jgi:hypothetical protein